MKTSTTILCAWLLLGGAAQALELRSRDFTNGGALPAAQVYRGFGCDGANLSPHLAWTDPPAGTKSFAVTAYDPDAPTGSGWWHWVVYDLAATVRALESGAGRPDGLPAGARHGRTDFGTMAFGGACPPPGDKAHRYVFTVHALKVDKLDVPPDASAALIGYMINANRLGSAAVTATYGR
ncbi:YbhB/YbcL family Raf kinase inhibitor-like protein [Pseudoduganella sp. SL102]|uniref:YbhB/YbcL family Raf kinase inhibitor-like protein n=1 Tax=Pseudoduganella sp. SL102 TaxID=2995154 RepID=UPI00248CBD38|nr:YbhB/YbcL family Raf kinase inhibitor-like protein [Pseudoduganella sp. SL102]WBS02584.1 YbhB/YbcL family Raf kinase inhibitor-like protein [Pseudoduganella sp. SL102]